MVLEDGCELVAVAPLYEGVGVVDLFVCVRVVSYGI